MISAYSFSLSHIPIVAGTIIPCTLYRVPKRSSEILGHGLPDFCPAQIIRIPYLDNMYEERKMDHAVSKITVWLNENFFNYVRLNRCFLFLLAGLFHYATRTLFAIPFHGCHCRIPTRSAHQRRIRRIRECSYLRTNFTNTFVATSGNRGATERRDDTK